MFNFFREFIIKFKKGILGVLVLIAIISVVIVAKVNVKAGNAYEVDYSNKRFYNYTVVSGDSLWTIAEQNMDYDHYDNIYEYMNDLKKMNHLSSDNITIGQNLLITYYETSTNNINY